MLYQLGRVCFENFNTQVFIIQDQSQRWKKGQQRFHYKYTFPTVTTSQMMKMINENDLFICNPVQSAHSFGTKLPAQKLMYLQGVNTYDALDLHFDHYVSVSQFVQEDTKTKYGVDSSVINPFINLSLFHKGMPWGQRKNEVLVLGYKKETQPLLNRLRKHYNRKYRGGFPKINKVRNLSQQALAEVIGRHKYYLTLTPVEGFGLPSLEAMASGCVVIGFDAYGGRDYFETGKNAYVVEYDDFDRLADYLYEVIHSSHIDENISRNAISTAANYSFDLFSQSWRTFLKGNVLI